MPKAEKQKQKLLYIIKMLQDKSDENHPLKMNDILTMLDSEGIKAAIMIWTRFGILAMILCLPVEKTADIIWHPENLNRLSLKYW